MPVLLLSALLPATTAPTLSPEAKTALMQDAHPPHQALRRPVQWALGRVSADPGVLDVLRDNMRHDGNLLIRNEAACALACDPVHLTPAQKLRLYQCQVEAS